ncbi:polyketide cyclase/dehydrase/lipid transport protein [Halopolyspora algeriensis]|uniref:Polyketide cyclase/dehydrase/lipid transport protein n=1 Tax=Halopolyspora algeriensis TaxID=1500506 RepID=A0A368VMS7_9ACTN|nr:SRPBCC family protein [Halopolyspora algeriensis]RCW42784.1 polyketide cyclase/dehydrase/lipid transport protein [Halopolyspora algeriensis]TQM56746.1 polyketide cyclase/dehydrase/lipid transport protein [Halopolyspora algeriensis]
MGTAEVRRSVQVPEAAEVVWAAATDWPGQSEWMFGTEVHVIRGHGAGPGSELAAFTGLGGIGFLDRMEITEWEPPLRCVVRHTGPLVRGTGGFRVVRSTEAGSTFLWWERFELPTVGSLAWPLVRPGFEWGLQKSLERFAAVCSRYRHGHHGSAEDHGGE